VDSLLWQLSINNSVDFQNQRCSGGNGATLLGRFPFDQKFQNFETGTNGTEISWDKFQKIRKLLNFRKANHSTENSGNSGMKIKWNRNFQEEMFENLGIAHEVVLFFRNYANSQFSYSALVLLAAITASWTYCDAHSEMEIL